MLRSKFRAGFRKIQKLLKGFTVEERRAIYLSRNPPQSDFSFVEYCFEDDSKELKKVAIAIRESIAQLGGVDRQFIRAESSFEELVILPFWKNIGDIGFYTEDFIEAVERKLGVEFTQEQLRKASVRDPDLNTDMAIAEFVRDFYDWYRLSKFV